MIHLQAITPSALAAALPAVSLVEARKIIGAIHRHDILPGTVKGVRRAALEEVRSSGWIPRLELRGEFRSRIDPFIKYTLGLEDGNVIETVRIPLERHGRFSVCVSSQAGCGLGCAFCATGKIGLQRNLKTWEIVEQIRVVRRGLDRSRQQRVHGIVFQGMGEPLANMDNIIDSIRVACEPSAMAVDGRAVTVCTAGVPPGIRRLAREAPKARLAISIGSARDSLRAHLMPVSRAYPIEEVMDAAIEHALRTRLAPMWAITLLKGINDSESDAQELASLAHRFTQKAGLRPRISIVPFNPIDPDGGQVFERTPLPDEQRFRKALSEAGCPSHKRYSGGSDVDAACGQLAGS